MSCTTAKNPTSGWLSSRRNCSNHGRRKNPFFPVPQEKETGELRTTTTTQLPISAVCVRSSFSYSYVLSSPRHDGPGRVARLKHTGSNSLSEPLNKTLYNNTRGRREDCREGAELNFVCRGLLTLGLTGTDG
jgi:hypothetical protein